MRTMNRRKAREKARKIRTKPTERRTRPQERFRKTVSNA